MTTIIPANPGFEVETPDRKRLPVIGWELTPFIDGTGIDDVRPITPLGLTGRPFAILLDGRRL